MLPPSLVRLLALLACTLTAQAHPGVIDSIQVQQGRNVTIRFHATGPVQYRWKHNGPTTTLDAFPARLSPGAETDTRLDAGLVQRIQVTQVEDDVVRTTIEGSASPETHLSIDGQNCALRVSKSCVASHREQPPGERFTGKFIQTDTVKLVRLLAQKKRKNAYIAPGIPDASSMEFIGVPAPAALPLFATNCEPRLYLGRVSGSSIVVANSPEQLAKIQDDVIVDRVLPKKSPDAVVRQEFLVDDFPAAKVMGFLQERCPDVQLLPHPTMNGFYAVGRKEDVLELRDELADLGLPPDPPPPPIRLEYRLKHGQADAVSSLLKTMLPNLDIQVEERPALLLEGAPAALEQAKDLLDQIDRPQDQIMLECKLFSMSSNFGKMLALRWQADELPVVQSRLLPGETSQQESAQFQGFPPSNPAAAHVTLGQAGLEEWRKISPFLVTTSEAHVLASPRVACSDGTLAEIHVGDQFPYTRYDPQSGQFRTLKTDCGFKLQVRPTTQSDGTIACELQVDNSLPGEWLHGQIPVEQHLSFSTRFLLQNGQPQLIDGIFPPATLAAASPLLADFPIIGGIFRNARSQRPERLVLWISAKVMK